MAAPSADPPDALPEPTRHLAPKARWVWRAYWALGCLVALVLARSGDPGEPWDTLAWALPLAALAIGTPVVPDLRWRRWRWEVREHEIDLLRGVLVVRRTLVPMARVQHVETDRGVLEQTLGLASVEIHTAAGSHKIPLLTDYDAGLLRARIAELARTTDDADRPRPTEAVYDLAAPERPRPPAGGGDG